MKRLIHLENHEFSLVFNENTGEIHFSVIEEVTNIFGENEILARMNIGDVQLKNVFALKAAILKFIADVVKRHDPRVIFYSANEEAKILVYYVIAARIAKKHGYQMVTEGSNFYLYKEV